MAATSREQEPQKLHEIEEDEQHHAKETITFINEKGQVEHSDPSPVEQVRLTVSNEDDPDLPVWTFRSWVLGLLSCAILSFVNTFFSYRTEPVVITMITIQVISLPMGRFFANVLPTRKFKIGSAEFSLNPGPFNVKEHVLISLFANAGSAFGSGTAYAQGIVDIIKVFYHRKISFVASCILIITTQVLGYGWAGILRKYVVDPAYMWWPTSLVQVSLFRAMHDKEDKKEKRVSGKRRSMSRNTFFIIALISSFAYHIIPEYLFGTLQSVAWLCWISPKSVFIHQLGSGYHGMGLGTFGFDWGIIVSYLGSPLATPLFVVVNIMAGYVMVMYVVTPLCYYGLNLYGARKFPIFSQEIFDASGAKYNISAIVNDKFELDIGSYDQRGKIYLTTFFAITYGIGFASVVATLTHVALFYGREIYQQWTSSRSKNEDIHTKLMRRYKDIPGWWFYLMLLGSIALSLVLCIFMKDQVQLPWWGLLFAAALALVFTLPISIITATTNQTPGLNIITEYIMGVVLPGHPIANVCFKTYGYISMAQAVSFLSDFKLGHYMKIPPRSMFMVQLIGTILAGTINLGVAWWLLTSIPNICDTALLPPTSPWTCPSDAVFFDASVIWGLVGPRRIFGPLGDYSALNWFFLGGAIAPALVWILHKMFPKIKWIRLVNIPVLLGSTAMMPPATSVNYNTWILVAIVFSFYVFYYRKKWWQKYNYVLSASLDAGLAFFVILKFFGFRMNDMGIDWWGGSSEHCDLARCPTAKGVVADGCPVVF